jgi:hypothetical protein
MGGLVLGKVSRLPKRAGKASADHIVWRLAISRADWPRARLRNAALDVTIARYVGLAVEQRAPRRLVP